MTADLHARITASRPGFSLDVTIDAAAGTTVVLVGPNGAGKSTTLRAIAGLTTAGVQRADVSLGDTDLTAMETSARPIGVVFQDVRLFPHLDALDNVAYPLRAAGERRRAARAHARPTLAACAPDVDEHRRPASLSGGQAQRVALARALAAAPAILLLDEPFAAVDAAARPLARAALADHLEQFPGITLLVTHDPADALLLGDRIAVIEDGVVTQIGTPTELARRPSSPFTAALVGTNLLLGTTASDGSIQTDAGTRITTAERFDGAVRSVGVLVPPAAIALHADHPGGTPRNAWDATVVGVELLGARVRVALRLTTGDEIVAEVTIGAMDELSISAGGRVVAVVKATEITVISRAEGGAAVTEPGADHP